MTFLMDRETIFELLTQLGRRLEAKGIAAELYVVGGTAMILAYNRTVVTRDIDAVSERQEEVDLEAQLMASERPNLPTDWLNSQVKSMLPRVFDQGQLEAFTSPGITINVASPEHMMAMKVRAARDARDLDDIMLLCNVLKIKSVPEVFEIADNVWGWGMIRAENVQLVQDFLAGMGVPLRSD